MFVQVVGVVDVIDATDEQQQQLRRRVQRQQPGHDTEGKPTGTSLSSTVVEPVSHTQEVLSSVPGLFLGFLLSFISEVALIWSLKEVHVYLCCECVKMDTMVCGQNQKRPHKHRMSFKRFVFPVAGVRMTLRIWVTPFLTNLIVI